MGKSRAKMILTWLDSRVHILSSGIYVSVSLFRLIFFLILWADHKIGNMAVIGLASMFLVLQLHIKGTIFCYNSCIKKKKKSMEDSDWPVLGTCCHPWINYSGQDSVIFWLAWPRSWVHLVADSELDKLLPTGKRYLIPDERKIGC